MLDSKILIVDDEETNVVLLECMLERAGYTRLRTTISSMRSLEIAAEWTPDLVLLDLHMPELDGFGVMEKLRASRPAGEYLPILVLTADVNRRTRQRALAGGASDFVTKPFEHDEVLLRCKNLLETRELYLALHDQNQLLEEKVKQRTQDLEQALANLQRSQQHHIEQERLRALGEMSSGVAMDFNNQLTVLIGYSELLLLNNAQMLNNKAMAVHYLETIHTAAQESATVVSRLREFSRSREAGDIFLAVDLQALVHEVAHLTRPKWREQARAAGRQVQVRLELEPVPAIAGNAAELRDVVTNLIFNAVDAMNQGGTITLRTRRAANTVLVEVVDTGTGMSDEVRRRCLEPFFTTKPESTGGLGLSMVYGIVKRHEGSLSIQTEPDKGSTFSLHFPVPATTSDDGLSELEPMRPTRSLRVLLVEEDPQIRDLVCEYLRHDRHEVSTAVSGREGLVKFAEGGFDLVVTDLSMDEMNGEDFAAEIKALGSTPVIMLTASTDMLGEHGEKPDMVDMVVRKPLGSGDLWRAMAQVMTAKEV